MFCKNCGAPLGDNARFCTNCGTQLDGVSPSRQEAPAEYEGYNSKNIKWCADEKYRWIYELNMYKSTAIIWEVFRCLGIAILAVLGFMFVITIGDGLAAAISAVVEVGLIMTGIFLVLAIIGYLIVAFMFGGKYCVVFEMEEEGILHAQQDKQIKKAQLMGGLTALAGAAGGRPGVAGTGILAATRTQMYTHFCEIKEIEAVRSANLIRLNGTLDRNQVYVDEEDFDFVLEYIIQHSPQAKVTK